MAQLARDVGVPESAIRTERGSETTWENGRFTAPILRAEGVRRVLVITDRLHMRRAAGVFVRLGFDVELGAVPIYEGHYNNVSMLTAGAREVAALAYYKMRDWVAPLDTRDGSQRARHENGAAGTTGTAMQPNLSNPSGPIVILGASYAGSWDLDTIAGHPIVNAGVPGQQSFEMLERFERDVVTARPRAVVLWGFINDVFRAEDIDRSMARVRDSYMKMIARARASGIEPILATEVTIRPPDTWIESITAWVGGLMGKESYQSRINRQVMSMNAWLVDLAAREGILVLDLHDALAEEGGQRRREFIEEDGSHITPDGYAALTQYATPILNQHFAARPGRP
jgi:lysophospholipase L1-like esterase